MSTVTTKNSSFILVLSCMLAFAAADISGWIAPEVISQLMAYPDMGETQAGSILTAELFTLFATVLVLSQFAGRLPTKALLVTGLIIAVSAHVISAQTTDYNSLLILRSIAGIGMGLLNGISVLSLASASNASSQFAKLYMCSMVAGSALMLGMSPLKELAASLGFTSVFIISACLVLILAGAAIYGIPKKAAAPTAEANQPQKIGMPNISSYLMVLGSYVFAIGCGITFAFSHVFGEMSGVGGEGVNNWLGIGIALGVPCLFICSYISGDIKGFGTILALLATHALANYLITQPGNQFTFVTGLMLNIIVVYFLIPFLQGIAIRFDPMGGCSAAVGSSFPFSVAIAGVVGGFFMETFGPAAIGWIVIGINIISALIFITAVILFNTAKTRVRIPQTA